MECLDDSVINSYYDSLDKLKELIEMSGRTRTAETFHDITDKIAKTAEFLIKNPTRDNHFKAVMAMVVQAFNPCKEKYMQSQIEVILNIVKESDYNQNLTLTDVSEYKKQLKDVEILVNPKNQIYRKSLEYIEDLIEQAKKSKLKLGNHNNSVLKETLDIAEKIRETAVFLEGEFTDRYLKKSMRLVANAFDSAINYSFKGYIEYDFNTILGIVQYCRESAKLESSDVESFKKKLTQVGINYEKKHYDS